MGMSVGGTRGGAISSINVTPMADVIIVLLIIFMVTIPVISRGEVDLPDATRAREGAEGPIVVTVLSNGSVLLSDEAVVPNVHPPAGLLKHCWAVTEAMNPVSEAPQADHRHKAHRHVECPQSRDVPCRADLTHGVRSMSDVGREG